MTGQQHAVMWLGLLLIVLRLFTTSQWRALEGVFKMSDTPAGGTGVKTSTNPGVSSIPKDIFKTIVNPVLGL